MGLQLMIRQSVEKVGKLLRDRTYSVPESLYKFYALACYYAARLDCEEPDYNVVALFAEIHRLFKAYLVDEPYRLSKLTIPALANDPDALQDFTAIQCRLLKEFPLPTPKESFMRELVRQAGELSWVGRLQGMLLEAQEVKRGLESKKGEGVRHAELTVLFWFRQLKGEYLVTTDAFLESFTAFAREHLPVLAFLNKFSSHGLRALADPDDKRLLTIINCDELLHKLRDPTVLTQLWQQTQESKEEEPFRSEHTLRLSLVQAADSVMLEKIEASGEKVGERAVQRRGVVLVGSAVDNDIVIKSKYVSRRQMMVVEERKEKKEKEGERPFAAVCLSQTNFTAVKYPRPFKLHIGDIFYSGKIKYQLLRLHKDTLTAEEEEEDRTMTVLPGEREGGKAASDRATFMILSGEDKEKEFSVSSVELERVTEMDKHEHAVSQVVSFDGHFQLRPGARVLLKNANEILENRLSRKMRLVRGMEICLEEYSLIVD